jgi:nitrite reductase/ring-hydroxylating ferredoxin subunit
MVLRQLVAGLVGLLRDRGAINREHGGRVHNVARVEGSLDATLNVDMHFAMLLDYMSANKAASTSAIRTNCNGP